MTARRAALRLAASLRPASEAWSGGTPGSLFGAAFAPTSTPLLLPAWPLSSAVSSAARPIASIAAGATSPPPAWRSACVPGAAARASVPGGVRVVGLRPLQWPAEDEEGEVAPTPTPARPTPAAPAAALTTWADAGWTRRATVTLPNALSVARLLSAPVLASLISSSSWPSAAALLVAAAISDWADGAAARALGQGSVLGTYLDPVADKAVVCAVAASLASQGALPVPLAVLIVGRDVALVVGAVAGRLSACGWAWPGGPEFFRLVPSHENESARAAVGATPIPPAPAVRPLPLSKLNTALQFGLGGAAICTAWGGWPGAGTVEGLAWAVGAATAGSGLQYGWAAWKGKKRG